MPATLSPMLMPTRTGGRSVAPGGWLVRWRKPPTASPITPKAARSRCGPSWP